MNVATRLAGFMVTLLAVFGLAVAVGNAVGPIQQAAPVQHGDMADQGDADMDAGTEGHSDEASSSTSLPKGLMVSQDGYTFLLAKATVAPGARVPIAFTIQGPDGSPVTEYDVEHEKDLHLIAVRRDFSGFQHVHPVMDSEGTWRSTLDLSPGQWRLFADFKATGGEALTLGNDLAVRGAYRPSAPGTNSRTSTIDGYTVTLTGHPSAGAEAKLTLNVSRDGKPVTDLQPYLGAYGHLVALREGDLAYLHVHPEGTPGDDVTKPGPDIVFFTEVPSLGRYHLYLDFKHEGVVRTAAFIITVTDGSPSDTGHGGGHSDHGD